MASEIKSDKLSPSTGTALQIGDASDTITIPTGATFTITDGLSVASGSTGQTSWTAGDVLYATGTTALAKLAKGTAEQVLAMNSGATAPDWGSVDLTFYQQSQLLKAVQIYLVLLLVIFYTQQVQQH